MLEAGFSISRQFLRIKHLLILYPRDQCFYCTILYHIPEENIIIISEKILSSRPHWITRYCTVSVPEVTVNDPCKLVI